MSDPMKKSTHSSLIAASKVEGKPVFNPSGEKLGAVKELYIDKASGEVEFAALSFGGMLGVGEKYHPLPWGALDYDIDKDGFVVDIDKNELESSPAYEQERLSGVDYGWGAEVRDYYASHGGFGERDMGR
jgi:hypothetical protein